MEHPGDRLCPDLDARKVLHAPRAQCNDGGGWPKRGIALTVAPVRRLSASVAWMAVRVDREGGRRIHAKVLTRVDMRANKAINSHGKTRTIPLASANRENRTAIAANALLRTSSAKPARRAAAPCRATGPKKNWPNSGPVSGSRYPETRAPTPHQSVIKENGETTRTRSVVCSHVGSDSSDGNSDGRMETPNLRVKGRAACRRVPQNEGFGPEHQRKRQGARESCAGIAFGVSRPRT